ncbi:HK97 gp10 family phage protein [Lysinibacillus xylanilyticus]|uniref:HK97 gp10 family phage protein n=1 Tax=Lysinibacillus xylanilyticus TaxID=582475 RepID=UPI003CFCE9B6
MSIEMDGLTDFQKALFDVATRKVPNEAPKLMRKIGSKARTKVARKARSLVKKKTGMYHKKWKRGKVFVGYRGELVVRVYNSSPHAHLVEDGHRMVDSEGNDLGRFVHGKKPLDKGMREFEASGEVEKETVKWLDELLAKAKL